MKYKSLADLPALRATLREHRQREDEARKRREEAEAQARRERELFSRTVGEVTPLKAPQRALRTGPKPPPLPRQRERDEQEVLRASLSDGMDAETLLQTDQDLSFRRSWVGEDVLRKLRRGVWVVQGQIDLHGLTRDEARDATAEFLTAAVRRGWRCVRVVHGKGLGSPGRQPVLKAKVRRWLEQRDEVIAFAQARAPDGGAGALIVLLDSISR